MHSQVYILLGIVFLGLGARYAVRGYAHKSKPRVVNGIAIALVGVAQFFRPIPLAGMTFIGLALVTFVYSLILISKENR
jgi:hypothetical protein